MASTEFAFDPPASQCMVCGGELRGWADKQAYGQMFHYDRCRECGLVLVNPRPTMASLAHFNENWRPDGELLPPASSFPISTEKPTPTASPAHRRFMRKIAATRPARGRFLDIGSGSGSIAAAAAEMGFGVTALEVDSANVAATGRLPRVQAVRGLFESYEAPESSFDVILMSHVIEHVHDPKSFVAKAHRLLAVGGGLWVLAPNFDGLFRRLWGVHDPYFIPPTHLNHFNPRSLGRLCESMGFTILHNRDYFDLPADVLSKRVGSHRWLVPAARIATVGLNAALKIGTRLTHSGLFVSLCTRKS